MTLRGCLLAGASALVVLGLGLAGPDRTLPFWGGSAWAQAASGAAGASGGSSAPTGPKAVSPAKQQGVPVVGTPHTLSQALAATYAYQPALQAARAQLRSVDENVPTALSGWRPTVILNGGVGYGDGVTRTLSFISNEYAKTPLTRDLAQATTCLGLAVAGT